jgi:hypothetical protein
MATNLTDDNNCIQPGLRVDIMRCSMENKNLLTKKGSIYVGTGESFTVGEQTIYKTKALELGGSGEVLQVINGNLGYDKIQNSNFDSEVNYSNLTQTMNGVELTGTQFLRETKYDGLTISNSNINLDLTKNIKVVPSDGAVCTITPNNSRYTRQIKISQDSEGKLQLSYIGAGKKVYKHDVVLSLFWKASSKTTDRTTFLYFSFINGTPGTYEEESQEGLNKLLKDLVARQCAANAYKLQPNGVSLSSGDSSGSGMSRCYRVEQASNSTDLGIKIFFLFEGSWRCTSLLLYKGSACQIDKQSVTTIAAD